jgi:transcriptional regulator with XRE-family HTH domain
MNNFKERLAEIMQDQKLKQGPFGAKIGVNQSYVSKWLDKTTNNSPTVEQLGSIAKVFQVNLTWLLTGEGEKYNNYHKSTQPKGEGPKYDNQTSVEKLQMELLECRKETIELYRIISQMRSQKQNVSQKYHT